jgi:4'-phosphopantetheinyl transferase
VTAPGAAVTAPRAVETGAVEVWRVRLDVGPVASLAAVLSDDERRRAAQFRRARDRDRFVRAHAALRTILARRAGLAADRLAIEATPGAKPRLADASGVRFNLSHADDLALCAVSVDREVGVDVERIRDGIGALALAERFFAPAEVGALRTVPAPGRDAAFMRAWTRKEAYVKARGAGLALALDGFAVPLDEQTSIVIETATAGPWSVVPLAVGPGYAAAVAVEGRGGRVTCRNFSLG